MTTADGLREPGPNESLLLTPDEAARLLRIGRTTIYALMKAGDLRPVHIGRSCRLSRAELERYVRRLEAPPPQPAPRSGPRRRTPANQDGLFEVQDANSLQADGSVPRPTTCHRS